MTISNGPSSLLDSVLNAQTTQQDIGVAVLKKAQDAMKQQGEAMVRMLEQAGGRTRCQYPLTRHLRLSSQSQGRSAWQEWTSRVLRYGFPR